MVYREKYTDPKKLVELIRIQTRTDTLLIIKGIAHEFLEEGRGDVQGMYTYFSAVYDDLYHSLIFGRLHLQEETSRLLEILATPVFQKTQEERQKIIDECDL